MRLSAAARAANSAGAVRLFGVRVADGVALRDLRGPGRARSSADQRGQFAQKDANGATTFRKFGKNNEPDAHPSSRLPTASDLARVTLRNVRALYGLPRGLITGEAVNASGQRIVGDVQFNVQVARRGTQPQERTLRASVDWPPHAVSPFELRTSFNLEQGDRVLLQLGPSPLR
jgi:hypothetical protein